MRSQRDIHYHLHSRHFPMEECNIAACKEASRNKPTTKESALPDTKQEKKDEPQWRGYILEHPDQGQVTHLPGDLDDQWHFEKGSRTGEDVIMFTTIDSARQKMDDLSAPEGTMIIDLETMEPA